MMMAAAAGGMVISAKSCTTRRAYIISSLEIYRILRFYIYINTSDALSAYTRTARTIIQQSVLH